MTYARIPTRFSVFLFSTWGLHPQERAMFRFTAYRFSIHCRFIIVMINYHNDY